MEGDGGGDGDFKVKIRPLPNHLRECPWLDPSVDVRKHEPFQPGDMPHPLADESAYATLFPRHREQYLKEIWPLVTKELDKFGIKCKLDLVEGSMSVFTTRRTWDPYAIINARDFIRLMSRSVPYQQALRIFDDNIFCDIIKIASFTRGKEQFVKRRQRLIGPNGQTLKALELLTKCYVLVQGNTVSAIGTVEGLKQVREVVEDCMRNIHPVYNIKMLMVKRELKKDPTLANEDWERFLPKFKKKNVKRKKAKKSKEKYTPFPPPQTPRKVDLQIESGEYFMKKSEKTALKRKEITEKQIEKSREKKEEREKDFVPPKETKTAPNESNNPDLKSTVENIKKRKLNTLTNNNNNNNNVNDYLITSVTKKQKTE